MSSLVRDSIVMSRALIAVEEARRSGVAEDEQEALERLMDIIRHKPSLWPAVFEALNRFLEDG